MFWFCILQHENPTGGFIIFHFFSVGGKPWSGFFEGYGLVTNLFFFFFFFSGGAESHCCIVI